MDKDQLIEDFFRSLRVTLTNAFSYPQDHPYFIKSVENFKLQLEATLVALNPLKINITNSGIVVDAKNLTRIGLYDELARLLHQRKIKSIEIKNGVTIQEIMQFFLIVSRPPKDILKSGGVGALFTKAQLSHFTIEELDYSAFLSLGGKDCTDIWGYMLQDAANNNQPDKLAELADNFDLAIKQVNGKDLSVDPELAENIKNFLVCLKNKDKQRFEKCSKDVFIWLLNNKKNIDEEKLIKFKSVFSEFSQGDLSSLFLDGMLHEDDFDSLSMQLFSKISKSSDIDQINNNLLSEVDQSQFLQDNPKVIKKIQNILSSTAIDNLSAVYRRTLESLIKQVNFSGKLIFNHLSLRDNYRRIVLSIFSAEQNQINLQLIIKTLENEVSIAKDEKNFTFINDLWDVLAKKDNGRCDLCSDLEKKLAALIEDIVLNEGLPSDKEFLIEKIVVTSHDLNFYLDRIFSVAIVKRQILNLFLKLFAFDLEIFYARLDKKIQDMDFLTSLIDAIGDRNDSLGIDILKHVYSGANQLIKMEVLKSMRKINKIDRVFLISALGVDSGLLKKDILSVLILEPPACLEALELLLSIPSPWGNKNKVIIENMRIVYELKVLDAAPYIKALSLRRFFWNKQLRIKASSILKEWNVS